MKIKTAELLGIQLDLAAARIDPMCSGCTIEFVEDRKNGNHFVGVCDEGVAYFIGGDSVIARMRLRKSYSAEEYYPTRNWSQAGRIIANELIGLSAFADDDLDCWLATTISGAISSIGGTPLIAAMRCYVATYSGDVVDLPDAICLPVEVSS